MYKRQEFRFGPGCLIASITDSNLSLEERNAYMRSTKEAKEKRRKISLEILQNYDPNITETLISSHTKYPTLYYTCLLYTSPSPRARTRSRMPYSA